MGRIRVPWTKQPQSPTGIDWSNPLARRLRYCSTLGANLVDLKTGKIGAPSGGPPTVPTRAGLARSFVNTSSQFITLPTTDLVSGYPLTVACWVSTLPTGAGQVIYSFNGTSYSAIAGYISSNTNAVLTQNTGSGNTAQGRVCPLALSYIVAIHRSGSWDLYVNGVLAATQNVGSNWGQPAAGNHSIGNRLNGSSPRYHDGTISDLCVFEGELSVAEIKSLSNNPWQIYAPLERRIWAPAAGGGTTITGTIGTAVAAGFTGTVNANRTLSGALGTATASGFQGAVNVNRRISGALGTAVASGLAGNVNANRTIAGALGTATASGFQGTVTNGNTTTIVGSLGTAVATGFTGGVAWNRYIAGLLGVATASGFAGGVANGTGLGHSGVTRQWLIDYYTQAWAKKLPETAPEVKPAVSKRKGRQPVAKAPALPEFKVDALVDRVEKLLATATRQQSELQAAAALIDTVRKAVKLPPSDEFEVALERYAKARKQAQDDEDDLSLLSMVL